MTEKKLHKLMNTIGESTRSAVNELTKSSHRNRNQAINFIAQSLLENLDIILEANSKDIDLAREKKLPDSMIDRLMLNEVRIQEMAGNMKVITEIQDPINRVTEEWARPNGLKIQRVTVPLGVIGIIYESRPNVTADAAALCIKSGNAVILRGGSESF
ncbi:MAG TPA: gamma-glutamyl-phosphate reductase, partial [Woeseiaceae bacterium]|nr:gamma-glutamyl-phosphate reductase [Woeseiaceae bacterium]